MTSILPGATVGIFGGGQLGRMTAIAAQTMGYRVHVLDPDPTCPARAVVDDCVVAPYDDQAAAVELASKCAVLTLEIETIAPASLEAAARHAPTRPGAALLSILQNRIRQKNWLVQKGFPVGPYRPVDSLGQLHAAIDELDCPVFVKACGGGYDGRGQVVIDRREDAARAWEDLGAPSCIVEKGLTVEAEISVLVARRPGGEVAVYPPAFNHHENRILAWSVIPAVLSPSMACRAQDLARAVAEASEVEGLLAVEMFVLGPDDIRVNELAPRPHNSYHGAESACATGQFEQLVRAVCDLPLGSVEMVRPVAIANLLGDVFLGARPPAFAAALAIPGVRLHLYGKKEARVGRKMGHLSAAGISSEDAADRVRKAAALLGVS